MFLAVRKDLGHRNKGFSRGTILALYINDIHEVLKETKQSKPAAAAIVRPAQGQT